MKKEEKKKTGLAKLTERLYDPLQFRIVVTGVMLAIGYFGVYQPLGNRIARITQTVRKARQHEAVARQINDLQAQVDRIRARLPKDTDTNEWVQYVLGGVRKQAVTLVDLQSDDPRRVGPFQAVALRVTLRGDYQSLESFLDWIDTNERLFRVDAIAITTARGTDELEMNVRILGLRG